MQMDYSLACYNGYLRLQKIREALEAALQKTSNAKKRETLQALRGTGLPGNPDFLYGSITAVATDKETIVGLQNKFLHVLNILQSADVRPTQQTMAGVKALETTMQELVQRWETVR